jgi:hypothetical protein
VPDDDEDLGLLDDVDASSEEEDEENEAIFEQSRSEADLLENDGEEKVECGISRFHPFNNILVNKNNLFLTILSE